METHDIDYTHTETEFDQMRRLLVSSYLNDRRPFNWRLDMAETWCYASRYLESLEYFTSRAHLWRENAGELVAFLIHYGFTYPQLQITYRYLEAEMFAWAEANWGGERAQIDTIVYGWDRGRQALLAERGYKNLGAIEDVRLYDLSRAYPQASLPPGFRFASMAECPDVEARLELEQRVWGRNSLDEAWFCGKSTAPSYDSHWDLLVIAPDAKPVATCLVWPYPENQAAEIDPLGTHPDYRKQGLAKALVLESFRRMQASQVAYAYIASYAQDPVVSHLYASLQPVETYQGFHWMKRLD